MKKCSLPRFIASGKAMKALLAELRSVSRYPVPVLLTGESGTGKEVIARLIHAWSGRRGLLVPVNAATLRGDLLESTLFGHVRGAFTGAVSGNPGIVSSAERGTLFLDEIGETDPGSQSRLLRFLDSGEYIPLGGRVPIVANARIVTATNLDLDVAIRNGSFRKDLYYRLSALSFDIPPLRERKEDILPLAVFFIEKAASKFDLDPVTISRSAQQALLSYHWPGNIRQLRNEINSAVLRKAGGVIGPTDLSRYILESSIEPPEKTTVSDSGLDARLDRYEKSEIFDALRKAGSNCSRAAEILGLKRTTLLYRMRRHGIEIREESDDHAR